MTFHEEELYVVILMVIVVVVIVVVVLFGSKHSYLSTSMPSPSHGSSLILSESLFTSNELVYFSPDATEILDTIDSTKVYVIGGLVDRSIAKNQSLDRASSLGVQCVRLPLAEYYPECQHRGRTE